MQKKDNAHSQLAFTEAGFERTAIIEDAKELIVQAAKMLSSLGPEFERISWMLEDSIMYVDELEGMQSNQRAFIASDIPFEDQVKIARKK